MKDHKKFSVLNLLTLLLIGILIPPLQGQVTMYYSTGNPDKFSCDGATELVAYDKSTGKCASGDGSDFNTFFGTSITLATQAELSLDASTTKTIYETYSGTCMKDGDAATSTLVFTSSGIDCVDVSIASNSQRVGPELMINTMTIDFSDKSCEFGIIGDPTIQASAVDQWDPATGMCNNQSPKYALTTVVSPQSVVVDILQFKCYLPWECAPRKLVIDIDRYNSITAEQRSTDPHLYTCIFETFDQATIDTYTATSYTLIGDPSILQPGKTNFKLDFSGATPLCKVGLTAVDYTFDILRSLCYRYDATGNIDAFSIWRQTYDIGQVAGLEQLFGGGADGILYDPINSYCFNFVTAAGTTERCAGSLKFNIVDQLWNYYCACGTDGIYTPQLTTGELAPNGGAPTIAKAVGFVASAWSTWSCTTEVIDVDIDANICYKGQYQMTLDTTRNWCGGIPLVIHKYDIIKWQPDSTVSGSRKVLIDLINFQCKVWDTVKNRPEKFYQIRTVTHTDKDLGYTCERNSKMIPAIPVLPDTLLGSDAVLFGGAFFDSSNDAHQIYFANDEIQASGTWDDPTAVFADQYYGTLLREWAITAHVTNGVKLWGTFVFPITMYVDLITPIDLTEGVFDPFHSSWMGASEFCTPVAGLYFELEAVDGTQTFLAKCSLDPAETLALDSATATNLIGRQRFHNKVHMDDKQRIDLSSASANCFIKGETMTWNHDTLSCVSDANILLSKTLDPLNYEITNTNLADGSGYWFINFIESTCMVEDSPWVLELTVGTIADIVYTADTVQVAGALSCRGYTKADSYGTYDLVGKKITYFGKPVVETGTDTYELDLDTLICTKKNSSGTVLSTATLDLDKQMCRGTFQLLLWLNTYTIVNAGLFISSQNINAVIDIQSGKCWVSGWTDQCDLASAANGNDNVHTCTCNKGVSPDTVTEIYTFSRDHENGVNFKYVGYKYLKPINTNYFERAPIVNPKRGNVTIKLTTDETTGTCTKADDSLYSKVFDGAKCGATELISTMDYKFDLSNWHTISLAKAWILDYNQMKCYKRGSCDVYKLVFDLLVPGAGTPPGDFYCVLGTQTIDQATLVADTFFTFGATEMAIDTTGLLEFNYNTGKCSLGIDPITAYENMDYEFNFCYKSGDVTFRRSTLSLTSSYVSLDLMDNPILDILNQQCYCNAAATAPDTTITISGDIVSGCCSTTVDYSIQTDYLIGNGLQITGYHEEGFCSGDFNIYRLDLINAECFYAGATFTLDPITMTCTGIQDTTIVVNLRGVQYEVVTWIVDHLYVADFNQWLCLSPGGNNAALRYIKAEASPSNVLEKVQCVRQNINGEEIIELQATPGGSNPQLISTLGKDNTVFAATAMTFNVDLDTLGCWDGSLQVLSLGTFQIEYGRCIKNGQATAYIGYNNPVFNYSNYFTNNSAVEIIYFFTEGKDRCLLKTVPSANIETCTATKRYNYGETAYPEMTFRCDCTGETAVERGYKDIPTSLVLIGVFETRYLKPDFYKTIDIDLVTLKCSDGTITDYNYDPVNLTCQKNDLVLDIRRQFYEIYNWEGKDTNKILIDKFRGLCFDPQDCTPMKYSNSESYDEDGAGSAPFVEYIFCKKIADADSGFFVKIPLTDTVSFGTTITEATGIAYQTDLCATTGGYLDPELMTCVDLTQSYNDTPLQSTIVANVVIANYITAERYPQGSYFSQTTSQWVFPAINQCIVVYCDTPNLTASTCSSTVFNKGYIQYKKKPDGTAGWLCTSFEVNEYIDETKALFFGGKKQIGNHCASQSTLFEARTVAEKNKYWIHFDLEFYECYPIFGIPAVGTWDITTTFFKPTTFDIYALVGLTGIPDIDNYDTTYQTCGNLRFHAYQYTWEHSGKNIFDYNLMKCTDDASAVFDIVQSGTQYECLGNPASLYDLNQAVRRLNEKRELTMYAASYVIPKTIETVINASIDVTKGQCTIGGTTKSFAYDDQICDEGLNIANIPKKVTLPLGTLAFIDLGRQECNYGTMVGHLVYFSYSSANYFSTSKAAAVNRAGQDHSYTYTPHSAVIQCRFYDITLTSNKLSIKEFQLSEVIVSGLNYYFSLGSGTDEIMRNNFEVYIIDTLLTTSIGNALPISSFRCIKVEVNAEYYNTTMPFDMTLLPLDTNPGWETYTKTDHKCGSTEMGDKYYKLIISQPLNFFYEFVVDVWGDQCLRKDGTLLELRYDTYGQPNACVDPWNLLSTYYLDISFKQFDQGKITKYPTLVIPTLPMVLLDEASILLTPTNCGTNSPASTYTLNLNTGMCNKDTEFANLCLMDLALATSYAAVKTTKLNNEITELFVNLCNSKCIESGASETEYDLIEMDEFYVKCQKGTDVFIEKYNKQFTLMAKRGSHFSTTIYNPFSIKEIEVQLDVGTTAVPAEPTCTVDGDPGWELVFKNEVGDVIANWYCFKTVLSQVIKHYIQSPDNHFSIKSDLGTPADATFINQNKNDILLRHRVIVDVFHGRCYFTEGEVALAIVYPNAQINFDMLLDANLMTIFSKIDNFSLADAQNLKLTCGARTFDLPEVYFMGYNNKITLLPTEACPQGTYKDPNTGTCELCMFECASCTVKDRCYTCIADFSECGDRCFETDAKKITYAGAGDSGVYWDANNLLCIDCPTECKDCSNDYTCSACQPNYVLYTNTRTVPVDGSVTAVDCIKISTCDSAIDMPLFFSDGTTSTATCAACDSSCGECHGSSTTCTACTGGNILQGSLCPATCQDNYYNLNGVCVLCDESCDNCTGAGNANCADGPDADTNDNCEALFYLQGTICTGECPYGQHVVKDLVTTPAVSQCQPCTNGCGDCQNGNLGGRCTACPLSKYYKVIENDWTYGTCDSTCIDGFFKFDLYIASNPLWKKPQFTQEFEQFVKRQPKTFADYEKDNFVIVDLNIPKFCEKCDISCKTCDGVGNMNCLTCDVTSYFMRKDVAGNNNGCYLDCPSGYYQDTTARTCEVCPTAFCLECGSSTTCSKCEPGFFKSGETCTSQCGTGKFKNKYTNRCEACDAGCTDCVDYKGKCTTCATVVGGKTKLDTITQTCVATCPSGTWDNSNKCATCDLPSCSALGVASGTCDVECATCFAAGSCLTCAANHMLIEDTHVCTALTTLITGCPSGYRQNPTVALPTISCQKCPTDCAECDEWGCTSCNLTPTSLLVKQWPFRYCQTTCAAGWFSKDGACKQCSSYCATCVTEKDICQSCTSGTEVPFKYDAVTTGQLCLCSLSSPYWVDSNYMELYIDFPNDMTIDWEYYISQKATFQADTRIKSEEEIQLSMQQTYNTSDFTMTQALNTTAEFISIFDEMQRATLSDMLIADERQQLLTLSYEDATVQTTTQILYDPSKSFGDRENNENLIDVLFEKQIGDSFGIYQYTTDFTVNKKIIIKLGQSHTYDLKAMPLIMREGIVEVTGCKYPIKRIRGIETPTGGAPGTNVPIFIPNLILSQNIVNPVPQCTPVTVTMSFLNFPKNQPKTMRWQLIDLKNFDGTPDGVNFKKINDILDTLPEQTTTYTFDDEITSLLVGHTMDLQVEATPFFTGTGPTAVDVIRITYASGGNLQLTFQNTETEFRFRRADTVNSFPFVLNISPCLLTTTTRKAFLQTITFTSEYFAAADCSGSAEGTFVFSQADMSFAIPALTLTAGADKCVKIIGTTGGTAGVNDAEMTITLKPIASLPIIINDLGDYVEVNVDQILQIPLALEFDSDLVATNSAKCRTLANKECSKLDLSNNPVAIPSSFELGVDLNHVIFTIAANSLSIGEIYIFELFATTGTQSSSIFVQIKALSSTVSLLTGTWQISGVESNFGLPLTRAVFSFALPQAVKSSDVFTWSYDFKDAQNKWQGVVLVGNTQIITETNLIIFDSQTPEQDHKLTLVVSSGLSVGRFIYQWTTKSNIDVTMEVTPGVSTTSDMKLFKIVNNDQTTILKYTWGYEDSTGQNRIITESLQDQFSDYISDVGDALNGDKLLVTCIVENVQNKSRKLFSVNLVNTMGTFSMTDLDQGLNKDQSRNVAVGLSKQQGMSPADITSVIGVLSNSLSLLNTNNPLDKKKAVGIVSGQITALDNNPSAISGVSQIDGIATNLYGIDQQLSSAINAGKSTGTQSITGVAPMTKIELHGVIDDIEKLMKLYIAEHAKNAQTFPRATFKSHFHKMRTMSHLSMAKHGSNLMTGQSFTKTTTHQTMTIKKFGTSSISASGRRLRGLATTPSITPIVLVPIPVCTYSYNIGTATLPSFTGISVKKSVYSRTYLSSFYSEDSDVPLCDPVDISIHKTITTSGSTSTVELINLTGLIGDARIQVCFSTSQVIDFETEARQYDDVTDLWIPLGEPDIANTIGDTSCFLVPQTGIIGFYEKTDENLARLYNGFILYVLLAMDVFLIVGIILGFKLDKEKTVRVKFGNVDHTEVEDKVYTNIDDDTKNFNIIPINGDSETQRQLEGDKIDDTQEEDKKEKDKKEAESLEAFKKETEKKESEKLDSEKKETDNLNPDQTIEKKQGETEGLNKVELDLDAMAQDKQNEQYSVSTKQPVQVKSNRVVTIKQYNNDIPFMPAFKIYHRCLNIYNSDYHFLNRPARVLSFALQLQILCVVIGSLIDVLDFGNLFMEAVVGYILAFITLRIANLVFYKSLYFAQEKGGSTQIMVVVMLALLMIGLHVLAIVVTLNMMDEDFTTWTVSFLVTIVVDLVVWELIVTKWQMMQVQKVRQGKKPCMEFQVSIGLKNAFIKK